MKLLKTFFTLMLIGFVSMSQSQTVEISGMVTNQTTGLNLANQAVYFAVSGVNDSITVLTDEEGMFLQNVEVTQQDSFLVEVSTFDACSFQMVYEYVFPIEGGAFCSIKCLFKLRRA